MMDSGDEDSVFQDHIDNPIFANPEFTKTGKFSLQGRRLIRLFWKFTGNDIQNSSSLGFSEFFQIFADGFFESNLISQSLISFHPCR